MNGYIGPRGVVGGWLAGANMPWWGEGGGLRNALSINDHRHRGLLLHKSPNHFGGAAAADLF